MKRNIRFTTVFTLTCCLLILSTLNSCGKKKKEGSSDADISAIELEKEIDEAQLRSLIRESKKPYVLVNFFATWCAHCGQEFPELVDLQKDGKSSVEVLFISIDDKEDVEQKLPAYLAENGVDFKTYSRSEDEAWFIKQFYPEWDGGEPPLSLIYTTDGTLVDVIQGITDRTEVELIVNRHKRMGSY